MILAMVSINIVGQFMIENGLEENLREIFLYCSISISIIVLLLGWLLSYIISKLVVKSRRSSLKSNKLILRKAISFNIGISDQTTYDKMLEKSLIISDKEEVDL